jgi:hypothetical protein
MLSISRLPLTVAAGVRIDTPRPLTDVRCRMPHRELRLGDHAERLQTALDALHLELEVPAAFPPEVRAEARAVAGAMTSGRDLTNVPFVTIDPPSSMDLDQAVYLSRDGSGYLVRYAIADVAAFVVPGGPTDVEAHRRGVTSTDPTAGRCFTRWNSQKARLASFRTRSGRPWSGNCAWTRPVR